MNAPTLDELLQIIEPHGWSTLGLVTVFSTVLIWRNPLRIKAAAPADRLAALLDLAGIRFEKWEFSRDVFRVHIYPNTTNT